MKSKRIKAAILAPAFFVSVCPLLACGPWFPNNMLDRGDAAVLVAPVADFYTELDRMQLSPPRFQAVTSSNSFAEETLQAELADLRSALNEAGKSSNDVERIVLNHLGQRAKLQKFADATPREYPDVSEPTARPAFPSVSPADGLPGEFADYFQGAVVWNNPGAPDKTEAREAWEKLLNRPPEERHYKSTWAAYMLGRSWETEDPRKARDYYQQVRTLAAQGFSDPAGLAAASLGYEARLALRTNDFNTAIELYLQQYAAKGWGSGESLQVTVGRAVRGGPKVLAPLALNPQARRLVTAYLISSRRWDDGSTTSETRENVKAWLEAVEQADVKDVESAEQFALAAYQADEMELAIRWVNRAGHSPTAQWLTAKLLLRAGKVTKATEILSQIVDSFPTEMPTNDAPHSFAEGLQVPDSGDDGSVIAGRYIRGELGALRLSRREYTQALDLLLRGDFSEDAAYVADHVLTTDELRAYVDGYWPAITPSSDEDKGEAQKKLEQTTSSIRYLLARRLARQGYLSDARAYYPGEWAPLAEQLMQALTTGWNESLPAEERAKALADAAFIARTNGMELLGTEAGPDWHIYGGDFEGGVTANTRTNEEAIAIVASADELKRNAESATDPDKRFHYRYQAAALAWEAVKLMPNNSDETARLLCTAGSWLKAREPEAADLFYKTLVNRCRKTEIGAKADAIRWFPELDADGNLRRARFESMDLPSAQELASTGGIASYPTPGKHFMIMEGDRMSDIVAAVQRFGFNTTANEIYDANPELNRWEYNTGREIMIPLPQQIPTDVISYDDGTLPIANDSPAEAPNSDEEKPHMEYTVEKGDTLAKIAQQFGVKSESLLNANSGLNSSRLKIGQRISIPGGADW